MVKNPPANAGDVDWYPGQEDPLEKEMATHSSILAWEVPWPEEPGGPKVCGVTRVRYELTTKYMHTYILDTEPDYL